MNAAIVPHSFSDAAAALAAAAKQERPVRIVGGGTKLGWGEATPAGGLHFQMAHLSRVVIHDDGAAATINAGTPLVRAQATFARSGLMLAADPQLGLGRTPAATIGGVVATADTGPLSHRHGPLRSQVLGITVALSDGSIVRTGPRTGHVQEGLDVARLFTGSFGTLGVILAVDVRLRPLPSKTASTLGTAGNPEQLRSAAEIVARTHADLEAFDFAWHGGRGGLLAQLAGEDAEAQAANVARTMRAAGLDEATVRTDDAGLWARQRAGQRSAQRALLRVTHRPHELDSVLYAADAGQATVVGRAALGIAYLTLDVPQLASVRAALPDAASAVALDLPVTARGAVQAWNVPEGPELELMRELKAEFDPAGVCNPGVFVGSI
ncbi:MAG: FAD-binding oxidoreductase [Solirubrobacteraceae bacterium]